MTNPRDIKARLIAIAEPACAAHGYELVDVDYESGNAGWVIRFYIDHAPGHVGGLDGGISFTDCESIARELSAVLDVEDPVPHAYNLEVSSPGLDRPLRSLAHFERQIGQTIKVELGRGLNGRRNFKGVLRAAEARDPGPAILRVEVDGTLFELPLDDLERARLVPDWDAVFRGQNQPTKGKGQRPAGSAHKRHVGRTPRA